MTLKHALRHLLASLDHARSFHTPRSVNRRPRHCTPYLEALETRVLLSAANYLFVPLGSFNGTVNGSSPIGGMVGDSQGDIFGITRNGGANGVGTIFEIAAGTTTIQSLASFNGGNGANPWGDLTIDSNGNVFGTTLNGGANGHGAIFELPAGSTTITLLASFNVTNGSSPSGGVVFDTSGNLYGMTSGGGTGGVGVIYELPAGGNTISPLASFDTNTTGANPIGGLTIDANGNLFGVAYSGGSSNDGTIIELAAGANSITPLASFDGTSGSLPVGNLILDSQGNLFGAASNGGINLSGTIYELPFGSSTINALVSFDEGAGISDPYGHISTDAAGDIFGSALGGGAGGQAGLIYELPAGSNTLSTLYSLNGTQGSGPSGVYRDSNGSLWVATISGGANSAGAAFELESATVFMSGGWSYSGMNAEGSITFGADNNISGGTLTNADGSVTTPSGTYTITANGSVEVITPSSDQTGAMNSTKDLLALDQTSTSDSLSLLIKQTATAYSNADLSGTWSLMTNSDQSDSTGAGTIQFDGAGNILGGTLTTSDGVSTVTGGTYSVSSSGAVTAAVDSSSSGGANVIMLTGQMNASKDVVAQNPVDLQSAAAGGGARLVVMVRSAGTYSAASMNGTWNMVGDGAEGAIQLDGKGHITGGTVVDGSGTVSTVTGTYSVSAAGLFTVSLTLTSIHGVTHITDKGALNASQNFVAIEPPPSSAAGSANSGDSLTFLVDSANHAPTLTSIKSFATAIDNLPYTISYNSLLSNSNAADLDGGAIGFLITSITKGTLMVDNITAVAGTTVVYPGDNIEWTPAAATTGAISAFTVKADDGQATSATAVAVKITAVLRPVISISAVRSTALEATGQTTGFGEFQVTRSGGILAQPMTVDYTIAGTAVAGTNYTALSGTVTIPAGKTTATFNVNPLDDHTVDPTLTVIATLAADPDGIYTISPAKTAATVSIKDDSPTLSIAATKSTALEATGQTTGFGQFTVTRTNTNLQEAQTVNYTITGTAVADTNYTPLSGILTIPAGKTSATITVNPIDDNTVDPTLTVIATLVPDANPSYIVSATRPAATVSIKDDSPTLSIAATKSTALEVTGQTTGFGQFTVTRTNTNLQEAQIVNYTVAGTAVADTNYTPLSGTVTIPAGKTSATIAVSPLDDQTVDPTLTVIATLVPDANPSYKINPTRTSATVNIIDDSPTLSIAATKPTALETTGQTTGFGLFTFTRTGGPLTNPLTVDYTISGTAVADTDYTALTGTVTFAAGASTATIEVNPIDNSNVGPSLTVVATLVPDANPSYKINPLKGLATINITENG